MIELTEENWNEYVLNDAKINYSGRLAEQIKQQRATLIVNYSRIKNKFDQFDVVTLVNLVTLGYLDQQARDLLAGLDPELELELDQIRQLLNSCLTRLNKLQVPDMGKLRELLSYL